MHYVSCSSTLLECCLYFFSSTGCSHPHPVPHTTPVLVPCRLEPRCFSLVLQPLILSPSINIGDVAVQLARLHARTPPSVPRDDTFLLTAVHTAHPFPVLERYATEDLHLDDAASGSPPAVKAGTQVRQAGRVARWSSWVTGRSVGGLLPSRFGPPPPPHPLPPPLPYPLSQLSSRTLPSTAPLLRSAPTLARPKAYDTLYFLSSSACSLP